MEAYDFLLGAKILDLRLVRGLGIVPARFELELFYDDNIYILETEVNFRVIYMNASLVCFDDLYLNKNYEEISLKKYRSQKNIENTLLFENIKKALKVIANKKIRKVKITEYGDVDIFVSRRTKIQIINDTHLNESCIFKIISKNELTTILTDNAKSFKVPKVLFEIINYNGIVKIINNLHI